MGVGRKGNTKAVNLAAQPIFGFQAYLFRIKNEPYQPRILALTPVSTSVVARLSSPVIGGKDRLVSVGRYLARTNHEYAM